LETAALPMSYTPIIGTDVVQWPADVEQVCNRSGPPPASDPTPVHLGA
jgi:hypothetical protein